MNFLPKNDSKQMTQHKLITTIINNNYRNNYNNDAKGQVLTEQ